MNNILTIAGQRGGSGKSAAALNLAVSLSLYERKVLLVDCDPHGCISDWSGLNTTGYTFDLSSVLAGRATVIEAVSKTEFNSLDILPAGFGLFPASLKLSRLAANEKLLKLLLDEIRSDYDFIILDTPSSFGYLSVAAFTAADGLLISICPRLDWGEDFHALLKFVQYVRKTHGVPLKITGLFFNRCLGETEIEAFLADHSLADAKSLVCSAFIPEDEVVPKAIRNRTPVALYDIKSPASDGYLALAREIIQAFN